MAWMASQNFLWFLPSNKPYFKKTHKNKTHFVFQARPAQISPGESMPWGVSPTWNWALMLGGFFFLCKCKRDFVVRSCRVMLMMSFRDLESSKFYKKVFIINKVQVFQLKRKYFVWNEWEWYQLPRVPHSMACYSSWLFLFWAKTFLKSETVSLPSVKSARWTRGIT